MIHPIQRSVKRDEPGIRTYIEDVFCTLNRLHGYLIYLSIHRKEFGGCRTCHYKQALHDGLSEMGGVVKDHCRKQSGRKPGKGFGGGFERVFI